MNFPWDQSEKFSKSFDKNGVFWSQLKKLFSTLYFLVRQFYNFNINFS